MKQKLILLLLLLPALTTMVQTDTNATANRRAPSIATIYTMDGKKIKGWIYQTDNENVYLLPTGSKSPQSVNYKNPDKNRYSIRIEALQINTIAHKKKHAGLKGALIGLGAGAALGAIIGFASGDDKEAPYTGTWSDVAIGFNNIFVMTAGEKAAAGAIRLGITGSITGAIIGALAKKKFIIGGNKDTYRDLNSELMQRLILK